MNSIDRNQPEENTENLSGQAAAEKIKELVEKASTCFFCTQNGSGASKGVRPMSVLKVDSMGTLWFLSANDSYKNKEIASNPLINLYFQGSAHSDFLHLTGKASISEDEARIKELWNPILKTWFTEGEKDPRISVIRVEPTGGFYWDNKHGKAVAGIKMLIGAVIGKTLDDSVSGKIKA